MVSQTHSRDLNSDKLPIKEPIDLFSLHHWYCQSSYFCSSLVEMASCKPWFRFPSLIIFSCLLAIYISYYVKWLFMDWQPKHLATGTEKAMTNVNRHQADQKKRWIQACKMNVIPYFCILAEHQPKIFMSFTHLLPCFKLFLTHQPFVSYSSQVFSLKCSLLFFNRRS